jgi:beta-barrel assembly-enhancing protease
MKWFQGMVLRCSRLAAAAFCRLPIIVCLSVCVLGLTLPTAHAADINEAREIEIGDELAVTLLEGGKLLNNDRAQEYVNQVGRWLTTGTERVDLPWQFGIMDRAEIGSYPLPGGKVLITRGMLKKMNNEAELAGVLAHEIAHVLKQHQLKTMAAEGGQEKLGAINFPMDRALEFEADRMAAVIMTRAGYDANAYLNVLRTLQNDRSNDQGLSMLNAVHPSFKDRIAELTPVVAKIPKSAQPDKSRERFQAALGNLSGAGRR